MNEKPIPEFMKEYMERIGPESFTEYQRLSKDYFKAKQDFFEMKMPKWVPAQGRPSPRIDVEAEMRRIDIEYKEKALDIGCKHGYEVPAPEQYDMELSQRQENGPYQDQIDKDDFGMLPEDRQAMQAHRAFEEKFPEKIEERQTNRETIEHYFGDGSYEPSQEKSAPQKEEISREELVSRFSLTRDDIIQPDMPDGIEPGRDEIEMDRDI